jgi:hypothetical protein
MIRANVGLSKKLSQNYNSTGFTINLDGEISAAVSDPQAVVEQIKELYDLAEEALDQQIERYQSVDALASHDAPPSAAVANNGQLHQTVNSNGTRPTSNGSYQNGRTSRLNGNAAPPSNEPATEKQVQFLLTIAKRQKITTAQLEDRIAEVLGQTVGLYDLTKAEAGQVITRLTNDDPRKPSRRQAA